MFTSALLASCLLLAQSEAPPASAEVASSVRRLLRQLDRDELAEREAAEKELIGLGIDALDHLPGPTAKLSTEAKDRLSRVRHTLENIAVETATKPSRVTLQGEMSLKDALTSLQKQTGNKITDYRQEFGQEARAIQLKMSLENKTFWEALDAVLDQAKMTIYNFAGEAGTIAIVGRADDEVNRAQRAVYGGMLRFEGTRIEAVRDLRNPENHSLRLSLDVAWEPRMKPIALVQALGDLNAKDEAGRPLTIDGREGEIEVPAEGDATATEFYVPLDLPDRRVKKIASLTGKMLVLAPGRVETFEFTNLEKAREVEQRRAGVTVILDQMRKNADVYEVRLLVKFDKASNALESHRGWIYGNPAYLVDDQGEVIENAGLEATRQGANEVGLSYKFTLEKAPTRHKFVYKTPAAILRLPVEYELKDIDLP